MKIDFSRAICDLNGEAVKNEDKSALTLKTVSVNSLLAILPNENPSGEEKAQSFSLAMKIHDAQDAIDLKAEEVVRLKTFIGKSYGPLVVGRAYALLENN